MLLAFSLIFAGSGSGRHLALLRLLGELERNGSFRQTRAYGSRAAPKMKGSNRAMFLASSMPL
jgi:hypothetical protein